MQMTSPHLTNDKAVREDKDSNVSAGSQQCFDAIAIAAGKGRVDNRLHCSR